MKKASTATSGTKIREVEPFDERTIDLAKFQSDVAANDWKQLLAVAPSIPVFPLPIDTLRATRTIGRGRTNVTIIVPTIVQTDATTPSASFDRRVTTSRNP